MHASIMMTINMLMVPAVVSCLLAAHVGAFSFPSISSCRRAEQSTALRMAKIGVFFGTSTGSTEEAADLIVAELGDDIAEGILALTRNDRELDGMKFTMVKCKILTCKERKLQCLGSVIPFRVSYPHRYHITHIIFSF